MTKRRLISVLAYVTVFVVGGLAGAAFLHLRHGYHYEVLKTESFPFPDGKVTLSYVMESTGMPVLDPETSVLTVKPELGSPITIYKAQRMFQESYPLARNVSTETNQIIWQDGINTYRLTIEPIEEQQDRTDG